MNKTFKIVAATGAALVIIGVFAPIVTLTAPFVGSITLIKLTCVSYFMIAFALLGAIPCLFNRRWAGFVAGLLVAASLAYVVYRIQHEINLLTDKQLAHALAYALSPGVGFAIIGVGALLLLISPWLFKPEPVEAGRLGVKIGSISQRMGN